MDLRKVCKSRPRPSGAKGIEIAFRKSKRSSCVSPGRQILIPSGMGRGTFRFLGSLVEGVTTWSEIFPYVHPELANTWFRLAIPHGLKELNVTKPAKSLRNESSTITNGPLRGVRPGNNKFNCFSIG